MSSSSVAIDPVVGLGRSTPKEPRATARSPRDQGAWVQYYDDEMALADAVAELVGGGLGAGDPVLLICTPAHRKTFFDVLATRAIDAERATARGQLVCLDADELLRSLMVAGEPSRALFQERVGRTVRRARAACQNRRLRVFGEMIDLLCKRGDERAALRLEELWNELAKVEDLSLLFGHVLNRSSSTVRSSEAPCKLHTADGGGLEAEIRRPIEAGDPPERLDEELAITSRVCEKLLRIGSVLSAELDLDALVGKLTDEATALCRAERGAFLRRPEGEDASSCDLRGAPDFLLSERRDLVARIFEGDTVLRIEDVTAGRARGADPLPIRSLLAVPVRSRSGEILGGLFLGHRAPGVFTEVDERLLGAVSGQATLAFENARLFLSARRAEEAAQRERERLRQLFKQSPALIVVLRGREHVYDFVNDAARTLLGDRDVIGKTVREVLSETDEERLTILDRTFETGERHVGVDLAAVHDWSDGRGQRERFFNVVYEPYRGPSGQVEGIMSFGFEVTEQVLAKKRMDAIIEELEAASRTKDEFLATVSHELRTPLTAILGWVRMLRSDALPEEKRGRALETIERNAHVQAQLIEDLLDVSRIICGKLRLDVGAVDVGSVVDNAIEAVRPGAKAKGVEIHQVSDPDAGTVLGDGDRLQQVLWNLLTNAVKFTPKGGKIDVAVRARDTSVDIVVADDGDGITPEFLPHVFERFRQADGKPTHKHGGLGLGLAIVRNLVELHGGSVAVESEGLGKGSTFTVRLPVSRAHLFGFERPPALRRVFSPGRHRGQELTGVRILVVDDEEDARDLLREVLATCGAIVSTARSVAEAMLLVTSIRPEIIVSDICMPEADGYELIKRLRALPAREGSSIPAVALTAHARVEDRAKALVAGFNMHVAKPVEPRELLAVLCSLRTMFARA